MEQEKLVFQNERIKWVREDRKKTLFWNGNDEKVTKVKRKVYYGVIFGALRRSIVIK